MHESKDKCLAVGECGLDYDRFEFADKETQLAVFPKHFELAEKTGLPLYLHSRNTGGDFARIVRQYRDSFSKGVVHSFTGDLIELRELLDLDLYIGVNGCSLKTPENIDVVRAIPLDKLLIETDCPYCEIRKSSSAYQYVKTHYSYKHKNKWDPEYLVRGRNEPCNLLQVLEAVSAIKEVPQHELANLTFENSLSFFNLA